MSEEKFETITSQEQLNNIIGDRLKRQKEQYESKVNELEEENKSLKNVSIELKALKENSLKSGKDIEEKEKTINELNSKLEKQEHERLKIDIALNNGLPYSLANRLKGDTEELLNEDAKALASMFTSSVEIQPSKDLEPSGKSEDQEINNLLEGLNLRGE